jgi:hypothetical protein
MKELLLIQQSSIHPHSILSKSKACPHGGQGDGVHGEGGLRFRKKSIWADNFPFAPTYQKVGALASKT